MAYIKLQFGPFVLAIFVKICLVASFVIKGMEWSFLIVKVSIATNTPFGFKYSLIVLDVDLFTFHRSPQSISRRVIVSNHLFELADGSF